VFYDVKEILAHSAAAAEWAILGKTVDVIIWT
jgi:hypothetical protein